jgi:thiol-disulfide isomerase/thioredoxin
VTAAAPARLPALDGAAAWLNSAQLGPAELSGHPVLVDFWTLTCINWLRTAPYLRAWQEAYSGDGLIIVGVHTPEFSFEHDPARVREAVRERGISYPVAVDSDYAIWTAFDNHYWPALYFAGGDGIIRAEHFGEGRYEQSEQLIQQLLGIRRGLAGAPGAGVEAEAGWAHLASPETYLGYQRAQHFASPRRAVLGERHHYELPDALALNHWALDGDWTIGAESAAAASAGAGVAYRFRARDAHLVLSRGGGDPIPFRVFLDGAAPGPAAGADVAGDGSGLLRDGRLYQLIRQHGPIRDRTVRVTFGAPGAEAYVFTFG